MSQKTGKPRGAATGNTGHQHTAGASWGSPVEIFQGALLCLMLTRPGAKVAFARRRSAPIQETVDPASHPPYHEGDASEKDLPVLDHGIAKRDWQPRHPKAVPE